MKEDAVNARRRRESTAGQLTGPGAPGRSSWTNALLPKVLISGAGGPKIGGAGGGGTASGSFKSFVVADRCIAVYGVSEDGRKQVAQTVNSLAHTVDRLVPKFTFDLLVEQSTRRIRERGERWRPGNVAVY